MADKAKGDLAWREARDKALTSTMEALGKTRDKTRDTLRNIRAEIRNEGIGQKLRDLTGRKEEMALLTEDGDAMEELDVDSEAGRFVLTNEQQIEVNTAMRPIFEEYEKLLRQTDAEGNPLYDREDPGPLFRDFWEPLVREGIIPESQVPNQFSEVKRTFTSASDLYDKELTEYSKTLTKTDKVLELFDLPVAVVSGGLTIASNVMVMEGAINAYGAGVTQLSKDATFKQKKAHADIVSGVAACLSSTKKAADAAFKKRDFQSASEAMIGGLKKILTATIGKDQANLITGIMTAASHSVTLPQAVAKGDAAGIVTEFGNTIADSLSASGSGSVVSTAAEIVKAQFAIMAKAVETAGDSSKAMSSLLSAALTAGVTAGKLITDHYKEAALEEVEKDEELSTKEKAERSEKLKTFYEGLGSVEDLVETSGDKIIELPEALTKLTEKAEKNFDKQKIADLKKKAEETQAKDLQDLLAQPDAEFAQMLAFGFAEDGDDPEGKDEELRLKSLENLLAEMARQQKIYDLAKTIVTGGIGAVEQFIPGLSAASAGAKTLFAFAEAAQKSKQLLVWFRNQKDAKVAVTVQYEVMMNRYGLQSEQAIVAGLQAVLAAIDTLGKAMQLAGAVAPIGVAISAGAAASSALIEVSMKVTSAAKMRSAWEIYKKALANPNDRKAARQALRTNPTLAKYALAWGAVEDGNRIAQSALLSCGIDEKTLATPGSDVAAVVKYLEAYFKDDPKLLREVPVAEKWYPGEIELTLDSWTAFVRAASKDASPKLDPAGSDVVATRLAFLEQAVSDLEAETVEKTKYAKEALMEATELVSALDRYQPKGDDKKPHPTMPTYVTALAALARRRVEALTEGLAALETA